MSTLVGIFCLMVLMFLYGFLFGHEAGVERGRELAAKAGDEKPHD